MLKEVPTDEVRRRYLDLLGAPDVQTLEKSIVNEILLNIGRVTPTAIPVRVSRAALKLLIDPKPRFSANIHEGRITFDEVQRQFVITLNSRYEEPLREPTKDRAAPNEQSSALLLRGRFTYAHEVAHRLCFVSNETGWERAVDVATKGIDQMERLRATRKLASFEEWLCNSVAGNVLIPGDVLNAKVGAHFPSTSFPGDESFYRALYSIAMELLVSRECLLRRINLAIQRRTIAASDGFSLMLISHTDRTPRGRSYWRSRVRMAIMPSSVGGISISSLAGVEIHMLGPEASKVIGCLQESALRYPHGKLETWLTLPSSRRVKRPPQVSVRLVGWWQDFGPGENGSYRDLLIWGRVGT